MKKLFIFLSLPLLFSLSTCRKIDYPEGDIVPLRKFKKYIDGIWAIKSLQKSVYCDPFILSEDSVPYYNNLLGGVGTVKIDYYNTIELNWGKNRVLWVMSEEPVTGVHTFQAGAKEIFIDDTLNFNRSFGSLPFEVGKIAKLSSKELIITGCRSRLILNK